MTKHSTSRRTFIKTAAAVAVAAPTIIPSSALGKDGAVAPSERIVMGAIGIGQMGKGDLTSLAGQKGVQYVAICDVSQKARDEGKARSKNKDCAVYSDFRELLARDDIDAVNIATPDHWHAVMTIAACQAGKDVYCQKPETRTLREGALVVAAAQRYGRIVSGGSQRVASDYRQLVQQCWSGQLGTVKSINVNVGPMSTLCYLPEEPVPEGFDWDMWLGPAPWAPYNAKRCSGSYKIDGTSWRSFLDYSGGGLTDWGAHHFGGATYAAGVRELQPSEVTYSEENGKAHVALKFPNGFEITHNKPGRGKMHVEGTPGETLEPKPVPGYKVKGGIYADFIHSVQTREKPFRDIEYAVNTMAVCHLAILAHTLKRSLKWDAAQQCFPGDAEANRYLDSARREPWQL